MNEPIFNQRIKDILNRSDKLSEKIILDFEKKLIREYKLFLKEIQGLIGDLFTKIENPTYADVIKFNRLTNLEKNIHDEIQRLTNESVRITRNSIKDLFSQNYYYTGYAMESVGVKLGFGVLNPKVIEAAILNPVDRIKWSERLRVNQALFERQIKESLTQGLIQGKGYYKIARDVKDRAEIGGGKVLRILRTEGHRAQNMGRLQGYEKGKNAAERLGLLATRVWVSVIDDRTRPDHVEMNGQGENQDGLFVFPNGGSAEAPGLSGIPEEDINCRCVAKIEMLGFGEGKIPPIMSYNEWASSKGI